MEDKNIKAIFSISWTLSEMFWIALKLSPFIIAFIYLLLNDSSSLVPFEIRLFILFFGVIQMIVFFVILMFEVLYRYNQKLKNKLQK